MNLMEEPYPLPLFANLQTDLEHVMRLREDQYLFTDSRKSLSQQQNTQLFGGVDQTDTTKIQSNYLEESPSAITWDLQESKKMERLKMPFH